MLASTEAPHDSETCLSPAIAAGLLGGARFTNSVVEVVWRRVPLVPVMVSDSAHGTVLVVVLIVSVEAPGPLMEGGLKPPLVMPVGNPDSLPTLRLTGALKPLIPATETV